MIVSTARRQVEASAGARHDDSAAAVDGLRVRSEGGPGCGHAVNAGQGDGPRGHPPVWQGQVHRVVGRLRFDMKRRLLAGDACKEQFENISQPSLCNSLINKK